MPKPSGKFFGITLLQLGACFPWKLHFVHLNASLGYLTSSEMVQLSVFILLSNSSLLSVTVFEWSKKIIRLLLIMVLEDRNHENGSMWLGASLETKCISAVVFDSSCKRWKFLLPFGEACKHFVSACKSLWSLGKPSSSLCPNPHYFTFSSIKEHEPLVRIESLQLAVTLLPVVLSFISLSSREWSSNKPLLLQEGF